MNRFLLDRLPDQGFREVKQDLIDTARKMLDAVLELCSARDRLTDYPTCIVWQVRQLIV